MAQVYFLGMESSPDFVKVGVSTNPAGRVKSLQAGSPFKLFVAHTIRCSDSSDAYDLERAAHLVLEEFGLGSEWFSLKPSTALNQVRGLIKNATRKHPHFKKVADNLYVRCSEGPRGVRCETRGEDGWI